MIVQRETKQTEVTLSTLIRRTKMLLRSIRFRATLACAARRFSAQAAAAVAAAVEKKAAAAVASTKSSGDGRDTLGRRLMSLVYAKRSAVIAIRKWKEEGHTVRKYDLNRIVRQLRKLRRYKHALEVSLFFFFHSLYLWFRYLNSVK